MFIKKLNLHRDQKSLARIRKRWKNPESHRIPRIPFGENRGEGSAEHSRCICVDRPSRSHHEQFRIQVLRIEPINTAVQRCARWSVLNLHRDKKM